MCPNRIKLDLDMKGRGGRGVEGLNKYVVYIQDI